MHKMQVQNCDVHDEDAVVSSTLVPAPVISRAYSLTIYTLSEWLQDDQF
jgi:hypothetical protein